MLFNSFQFLVIFPVVIAVYYAVVVAARGRAPVVSAVTLTLLSYAFYLVNQPAYTLVLVGVTLVTWAFGLIFDRLNTTSAGRILRHRLLVTAGVTLALVPLVVFKYYHFIMSVAAGLLARAGLQPEASGASWIIPLGISFFTFQALGYMWDVYYGKIRAERNLLYYALFVGFFPQIASGPISRVFDLLPQLRRPMPPAWTNLTAGFSMLLWGFFLKAMMSDRLATFVNPVFSNYEVFSGGTCFVASVFYSLQIYGDFAGYSLMAIGVARMMGYDLVANFNRPYFATSVTDFWRRWHISLSRWLRDYVYIPLGGSRRGKVRTYTNILVTFLVSGIWHGANFTFIVWGAIHGVVQCVEKFFGLNGNTVAPVTRILRIIITFLVVNFAWIFFRMSTLGDAVGMVRRILTMSPGMAMQPKNTDLFFIAASVIVVLGKELAEELRPGLTLIGHRRRSVRWATYIVLIFGILLCGVLDSSQFIYVNF